MPTRSYACPERFPDLRPQTRPRSAILSPRAQGLVERGDRTRGMDAARTARERAWIHELRATYDRSGRLSLLGRDDDDVLLVGLISFSSSVGPGRRRRPRPYRYADSERMIDEPLERSDATLSWGVDERRAATTAGEFAHWRAVGRNDLLDLRTSAGWQERPPVARGRLDVFPSLWRGHQHEQDPLKASNSRSSSATAFAGGLVVARPARRAVVGHDETGFIAPAVGGSIATMMAPGAELLPLPEAQGAAVAGGVAIAGEDCRHCRRVCRHCRRCCRRCRRCCRRCRRRRRRCRRCSPVL